MKKSDLLVKLYGLHQSTALLECLDWDQKAFDDISIYVSNRLKEQDPKEAEVSVINRVNSEFTLNLMRKVVSDVESQWGNPASQIIEQMFSAEALKLNLFNVRSNDVN